VASFNGYESAPTGTSPPRGKYPRRPKAARGLAYIDHSTYVETIYGEARRQLADGIVRRGIEVGDVGLNIADTLVVEFRMRVAT